MFKIKENNASGFPFYVMGMTSFRIWIWTKLLSYLYEYFRFVNGFISMLATFLYLPWLLLPDLPYPSAWIRTSSLLLSAHHLFFQFFAGVHVNMVGLDFMSFKNLVQTWEVKTSHLGFTVIKEMKVKKILFVRFREGGGDQIPQAHIKIYILTKI